MPRSTARSRRAARSDASRRRAALLAAAAVASTLAGVGRAATWNGGSGNWNNPANWAGGVPDVAGVTAAIDGGKAVNSVVTLDINADITSVNVDAGDSMILGNNVTLRLSGGGTVNGTITLASTGNFSVLRSEAALALSGGGQIVFAGTPFNQNIIDGNGPLTIGPGLTVRTGVQGGIVRPAVLTNQGVMSAETADTTLLVHAPTFVNQGTVRTSAGTFYISAASWTNSGRIEVSGTGLLRIGGGVTTAGLNLPGFARSGGTVYVTGVVDNTGATLALAGNTGSFELRDGTIRGGTVTTSGGAAFLVPAFAFGTLDGVTLDTDVTFENGATITVNNDLGIAAGHTLTLASTGAYATLRAGGAQTLNGAGQVVFGGTASNNLVDGSGPLTVGPGMTVRTGAQGGIVRPTVLTNEGLLSAQTAGTTFALDAPTFLNQGTVRASAGTFDITATNWSNTGTFDVSGGGVLRLGGNFTTAGINLPGIVRTGGSIDVAGTLTNAGAVLALSAGTGSFNLRGGTIRGGTVSASAGAALLAPANATGTLDGVALDSDMTVGNGAVVTVVNGLDVAAGRTVTLASTGSFPVLRFNGAQALAGGGQIVFGGTSSNNLIDGSGPLTIGPGIAIRTGPQSGRFGGTSITNHGLISAQDPAATITVNTTSFTNNGMLRAQGGGAILLNTGVAGSGSVSVGPSGTVRATFVRQNSLSLFGTPGSPATFGKVQIVPKAAGGQTSVLKFLTFQLDPSSGNAPAGVIDLADTALAVDYTGPSVMGSVRAALVSGFAGGAWNGRGINSSSIGSNPARALGYAEASEVFGPAGGTFETRPVDGSALLVRFTLTGDATLDGKTDFNDLVQMAQNYNQTVSATSESWWFRGDFTYDGKVDFQDLVRLAQNYNQVLASQAVPGAPPGFAADWVAALASVPEPGGAGVVGVVLGAMARRRRRG